MAETCVRAGIAPGTLRSVERGDERKRPAYVYEWIARALDTTIEGLLDIVDATSRATVRPSAFDDEVAAAE